MNASHGIASLWAVFIIVYANVIVMRHALYCLHLGHLRMLDKGARPETLHACTNKLQGENPALNRLVCQCVSIFTD